MFNNQHYIIKGVLAEIPFEFQLLMWECIDRMPEPKDYFQIFTFEAVGILQKVIHTSEQTKCCMNYFIPCGNSITAKVYVIGDGDHSTIFLLGEY